MADQSGRKISYGIATEATRGTAAATATYWLSQATADFQNKSDFIENNTVFGIVNVNSASEIVRDYAEGKLDGNVTDSSFGMILLAALGGSSVALHPGETAVYDNTFTQSQANNPQSLTIFRKDTNSDKAYALAMLKTLEIDVIVGEYVKFTTDWISRQGVTNSDTVAYALENRFKAKFATAKLAANTAGLAAATAVPLKSFKLTITRKLNPYYVFGSTTPNDIFVEEFDTKGEIVLRYTDQTWETPHYANTPQAISIDLVNTEVSIGVASNPALLLTLPKLTLNTWKVDENINNITEQTVGFVGLYDFVSSSELQAVLTNTINGY